MGLQALLLVGALATARSQDITPLTVGSTLVVPSAESNALNWYSFTIDPASAPFGFAVVLTPNFGDPDLRFSPNAPAPEFISTLQSVNGGQNIDQVQILPTDPVNWLPAGGPYFVEVFACCNNPAGWGLEVVPLGPSSSTASSSVSPSPLPTVVTPLPPPGSLTELSLGVPVNFSFLPPQQSIFYTIVVPLNLVPFGLNVYLQPSFGANADLYLSSTAPTGVNFAYQLQSLQGPGQLDTITLVPTSLQWSVLGRYYIEVYASLGAPSFSLVVVPVPAPITPSGTPSNTATPSPFMTAATPLPPVPGALLPLTFNSRFYFRGLAFQQSLFFRVDVPQAAAPNGFAIQLQPIAGQNADLYVSTLPPVGVVLTSQAQSLLGIGALDTVTFLPGAAFYQPGPMATYYIEVYAPLIAGASFSLIAIPLGPSPANTPSLTVSPTPSIAITAIASVPPPGSIVPLPQIGAPLSFAYLPTGASIFYSVNVPNALAPWGFAVWLTSAIGTNADIYVSNAPPVGAAFAYQAGLQSTLTGTVDTVTVMPTSPYYIRAGGTYYIEVFAEAGNPSFTLEVEAVSNTPSNSPQATTSPTASMIMTAITPAPSTGAVTPLTLNVPFFFRNLPNGGAARFSVNVGAIAAPFGIVARLQPVAGSNADLYLSSIAPIDGAFVYQYQSISAILGGVDVVTLLPNALHWQADGGTYYIDVEAVSGNPSFSLIVEAIVPATPTGTPSNSPSPTTYMTALAAPPLPGVITTVTLSNTFYFRTLPNLGSMFFMVTVPTAAAPFGLTFSLQPGPVPMNTDLYVSYRPPSGSNFNYITEAGTALQSLFAAGMIDTVNVPITSPYWAPAVAPGGASVTFFIEVYAANGMPNFALSVVPHAAPSSSGTPSSTPSRTAAATSAIPGAAASSPPPPAGDINTGGAPSSGGSASNGLAVGVGVGVSAAVLVAIGAVLYRSRASALAARRRYAQAATSATSAGVGTWGANSATPGEIQAERVRSTRGEGAHDAITRVTTTTNPVFSA